MLDNRIADWDDAYANGIHIEGGGRWPGLWQRAAEAFRARMAAEGRAKLGIAYGAGERHRFDLFLPRGVPKGLAVFVHGGYWMQFDQTTWSHLAGGAVDSGYAAALPAYTLCPGIRIAGIVREIGAAVAKAAELVDGPLMLAGHSAGGHLAARMVAAASPLPAALRARIRAVVSVSGLHDLRPLMATRMNETLRIDEEEALAESPALLRPMPGARITCWAGGAERPEFLRQNALLANIWTGLGAATAAVVEPGRHHFDIVDGLADAAHPLTRALLGEVPEKAGLP